MMSRFVTEAICDSISIVMYYCFIAYQVLYIASNAWMLWVLYPVYCHALKLYIFLILCTSMLRFSGKQNKKIIENVCKSMLQQVIRRMGSHKFQSFPILFIEIDRRRHATSLAWIFTHNYTYWIICICSRVWRTATFLLSILTDRIWCIAHSKRV